ncbi:MAG: hypothetical protein D6725_16995 [Planctomycetota bacterium]|nr:MAG: hypothetical protein D6725_16995 [Planctomycetota bacterium]
MAERGPVKAVGVGAVGLFLHGRGPVPTMALVRAVDGGHRRQRATPTGESALRATGSGVSPPEGRR